MEKSNGSYVWPGLNLRVYLELMFKGGSFLLLSCKFLALCTTLKMADLEDEEPSVDLIQSSWLFISPDEGSWHKRAVVPKLRATGLAARTLLTNIEAFLCYR